MTVLESLKSRAGLLVSGALSFAVLIGGMRLAGGEPVIQPQADVGVVAGVALITIFLVVNDTRRGARP